MPAYAYLRVSHENSAKSGAGIAAQETAVLQQFDVASAVSPLGWGRERYEYHLPGFFHDSAVSAFRKPFPVRPAGLALLKILKAGDTVFVSKADRMFRSLKDMVKTLEILAKRRVMVRFGDVPLDTSTMLGKMMLNIVVMMAEWESALKGQRVREANAIRKAMREKNMLHVLRPEPGKERQAQYEVTRSNPRLTDMLPKKVVPPVVENPPGRILIYIRCSHLDSVESGLGLEWQRQVCIAYANRLKQQNPNLTVILIYEDDAVSAWKHRLVKRPAGKRLHEELQPGDHVLFARLDRAFRSTRDMGETLPNWEEKGVAVHFVSEGFDLGSVWGQAVITILGVFAQIEPALTSARTKEAFVELRKEGRGIKRLRGFKWDTRNGVRSQTPDHREIALIRMAHWCHTCRGMGVHRIANLVEAMVAKRENRPIIPKQGWTIVQAERAFGNDSWKKYLLPKQGSIQPRVARYWHPKNVCHMLARWPLIRDYLEARRAEARQFMQQPVVAPAATSPASAPEPSRQHS